MMSDDFINRSEQNETSQTTGMTIEEARQLKFLLEEFIVLEEKIMSGKGDAQHQALADRIMEIHEKIQTFCSKHSSKFSEFER